VKVKVGNLSSSKALSVLGEWVKEQVFFSNQLAKEGKRFAEEQ
jgi:hypothetical protein